MIKYVSLFLIFIISQDAYDFIFWVSPTGISSWQAANSDLPLDSKNCTSLKTANDSANAGDIIIMRGGLYINANISPVKTGTSVNNWIIFQSYTGETPIITGSDTLFGAFTGIFLNDKHYIKINGIKVMDTDRWMNIRAGSSHIEISNCVFTESDQKNVAGIGIWGQCFGGSSCDCPVSHIWFHDNKVYDLGWVSDDGNDEGSLMHVGSPTKGDSNSNHNTIENNIFYHGGHHLIETFTKFNVIRNNYFHNEGFMPPPNDTRNVKRADTKNMYGNRCIQIYDGHNQTGLFNLIENNRFGHTGCPPDDGGGNAFKLVSKKNIARYNFIFNSAGDGIYFKQGTDADSDSNVVYNNTIYKTGIAPSYRTDIRRNGISIHGHSWGNRIKNNLICNYVRKPFESLGEGSITNNILENNMAFINGDSLFYNTDVSDPFNDTLPNLKLLPGTPCIERGIHLTTATNSGSNSTFLSVECSLYFQDGTLGSDLSKINADYISIGTVNNFIQIRSIDYKTNTINLSKPMSWDVNAKIWLYKDSLNKVVLKGNATDIGADESDNFLCVPKNFFPKNP